MNFEEFLNENEQLFEELEAKFDKGSGTYSHHDKMADKHHREAQRLTHQAAKHIPDKDTRSSHTLGGHKRTVPGDQAVHKLVKHIPEAKSLLDRAKAHLKVSDQHENERRKLR